MKIETGNAGQQDQRRDLVESLLKQQGIDIVDRIPRVPRQGDVPLAYAQERIWFLQQLAPDTGAYNMACPVRLRGTLNVRALEEAVNHVVARHESLRTTFVAHHGEPRQVIASTLRISPVTFDLSNLGPVEREAEAHRLVSDIVGRPFDLARGPLLNVTLIRLAESEHILLITTHHIIGDGWSLGIFFREFSACYSAFATGKQITLPELPIQYADFAEWQRRWLQSEVLGKQLAYWRNRLSGKLPILSLPTDYPRPSVQTFQGDQCPAEVPPALLAEVNAMSRREGVTPYMALLAAFQTFLSRHTEQEDIIVGTPIAGRSRPETESMIGLFMNTLILRTDLSGNPTFRELLHRVREEALEAYAHQEVPFGKLVAELQPERNLSYPPLFQVLFSLQNMPLPEVHLPGLVLTPVEAGNTVSKVDFTLEAATTGTSLKFAIEYNTALFSPARIRRMANAWRTTVEKLVASPDRRIGSFSILSPEEHRQIVQGWNETAISYPADKSIHELFEAQAAVSPDATAIVFGEESLTYREVNDRANRIACFLRRSGVQSETFVGILMDRSPAMVVALLGVLKAGGAYVPLDPAYPQQRITFMIEDSGMRFVLTESPLLGILSDTGVEAFCVDSDWKRIEQAGESSARTVGASDLAYLIYTSGSTGRPKGVEITHRAVVNFLESMQSAPGLNNKDVMLAVTTLSFDIAVLELLLPLTVGARVVIASRETSLDAARLAQLMSSSGATVMQATPAMWRMLIEAGWMGNPELKILSGGEALPPDLAGELLERSSSLWNMYGPTETTIWSSIHRVKNETDPVVIGRPIANTEIHVLDKWLNPVPIGVAGELYIGGDGLARGYWNRPELTAERFVPDPFHSGSRLYRTGDLARYLPDGTIECMGRVDYQVKIRGFRIELGEIEATLRQFPEVNDCVVVAREDTKNDKRLVGYFVAARDPQPSVSDLRSRLRHRLPEYMVPSVFVALNSIPRTPNGKVDRAALPAPGQARPNLDTQFVAPRNETEASIAGIWQRLLKVQRVGRDDNFFDLGGHSLLMVQVHSALLETLPASLTILDLFRYPTVKSLAEFLSQGEPKTVSFDKAQDRAQNRRLALDRTRQLRLQS